MSVLDGPGEGTWSVFATKVVEERDELRYKLAGHAAHIKSLEGLLVDAARERDAALVDADRRLNAYDAMRAALRHLLLSRDASWTGGHDWTEAVDDAVRALGIEGNHDRT